MPSGEPLETEDDVGFVHPDYAPLANMVGVPHIVVHTPTFPKGERNRLKVPRWFAEVLRITEGMPPHIRSGLLFRVDQAELSEGLSIVVSLLALGDPDAAQLELLGLIHGRAK